MSSLQRLAIAVVVVLLTLAGFYRWGYGRGWGDRDQEMQAAIAEKNEQARAVEQKLAEATRQAEVDLRKANDAVSKTQSDLDRAIRAGRVRLPAPRCVPAAEGAPAPAGDRDQARGQSDRAADPAADAERETLALIAAIAADGDRAINQLNACIDAYEQVRSQINAAR